jgi:hypothetical protein
MYLRRVMFSTLRLRKQNSGSGSALCVMVCEDESAATLRFTSRWRTSRAKESRGRAPVRQQEEQKVWIPPNFKPATTRADSFGAQMRLRMQRRRIHVRLHILFAAHSAHHWLQHKPQAATQTLPSDLSHDYSREAWQSCRCALASSQGNGSVKHTHPQSLQWAQENMNNRGEAVQPPSRPLSNPSGSSGSVPRPTALQSSSEQISAQSTSELSIGSCFLVTI